MTLRDTMRDCDCGFRPNGKCWCAEGYERNPIEPRSVAGDATSSSETREPGYGCEVCAGATPYGRPRKTHGCSIHGRGS